MSTKVLFRGVQSVSPMVQFTLQEVFSSLFLCTIFFSVTLPCVIFFLFYFFFTTFPPITFLIVCPLILCVKSQLLPHFQWSRVLLNCHSMALVYRHFFKSTAPGAYVPLKMRFKYSGFVSPGHCLTVKVPSLLEWLYYYSWPLLVQTAWLGTLYRCIWHPWHLLQWSLDCWLLASHPEGLLETVKELYPTALSCLL